MKHARFRLTGASKVSRLHKGDMQPPMMRSLQNFYVSRGDNLPTVRGDLVRFRDDIYAIGYTTYDALNTILTIVPTTTPLYITNAVPFTISGASRTVVCDTFTSTASKSTTTVTGSGTTWLKTLAPGHLFTWSGTAAFPVTSVTSDTACEVSVSGTVASATATIYKTHNVNAADVPLHVEKLGGNLIYGASTPLSDGTTKYIGTPLFCTVTVSNASATVSTLTAAAYRSTGHGASLSGTLYIPSALAQYLESINSSDIDASVDMGVAFASVTPTEVAVSSSRLVALQNTDTGYGAYSDNGSTWIAIGAPTGTVLTVSRLIYDGTRFVCVGTDASSHLCVAYSTDGTAFTTSYDSAITGSPTDIAYSSTLGIYVISSATSTLRFTVADITNATTFINRSSMPSFVAVIWDSTDEIFVGVEATTGSIYTSLDGLAWTKRSTPAASILDIVRVTNGYVCNSASTFYSSNDLINWTSTASAIATMGDLTARATSAYASNASSNAIKKIAPEFYSTVSADAKWYPVSEDYHAGCFGVIGGYLVLGCTSEYTVAGAAYTIYPRRIRWAVPATVDLWGGTGSGYMDLPGTGLIRDIRTIKGIGVVFESTGIGQLTETGDITAPFAYQKICEGIVSLSNPCVVGELCYFVSLDGILYSTNGVGVLPVDTAFDATEYQDFNTSVPIQLVYDSELNALMAYRNGGVGVTHTVSVINLEGGNVGEIDLPEIQSYAVTGYSADNYPRTIVQNVTMLGVTASDASYP